MSFEALLQLLGAPWLLQWRKVTMHTSAIWRISALSALLGVAAFAASAQQQDSTQPSTGDPVADAARKARSDQKTAPKPKKVFTNDDIPSAAPPPPPAATDAANKNASQQQADDLSVKKSLDPADDPKQEPYWRKRSKKLRDKLASAEQELDVLQRELNKDQVQYYPDPQKALAQQYSRSDINEKTAKVEAKKSEVESLKQQVADLEDAVRKAGGDPGWVR
jgi:predicted RNase H-like nuclease (RuvC/YqgF family)